MRIAGMVLLLLLLAGCGGGDRSNGETEGATLQEMTQADVETFAGAPIPEATQNVNTRGVDWQNTMAVLTFEGSQADVEAYLDAIGLTGSLEAEVSPFSADGSPPFADMTWWTLPDTSDSDLSYRGANSVQIDTKFYNVLVVAGDDDTATLWLQVLER